MKKYIIILISILALTSCEDFLTRTPMDSLSPETYFVNETECELYTNEFYTMFPEGSTIYYEQADYTIPNVLSDEVLGTRTVPSTSSSWSFTDLRSINFFLEYSSNCTDEAVRERYDGLARFFRAFFYFQKVKRYGDVPWLDTPLNADDPSLFTRGRDDRKVVMQHVLEDIDYAIETLPMTKNVYQVTKWTALALKARIFLFEGTFRKYHELGDWEECLEQSASAAETFINTSGYTLYKTGDTPYLDLFNSVNSDDTEIILTRSYSTSLNLTHDANGRYTSTTMGQPGITKDVINTYLMADGTRFTDVEGYETMQFYEETRNRDPRLAQTIRTPGYTRVNSTTQEAPNMAATMTGYQIIKYVGDAKYDSYNTSETDLPLFRTGEVYLNYAEAKAELGTLTQSDLDMSVNLLRDRVGMPHMNLANANADPDPYLTDEVTGYPNVSGPNTGIILEIRRERTVELMQEDFRYYDIMRWKAGKRFERTFEGMYFPGEGSYDLDGNGTIDFVIYSGTAPTQESGIVYYSLSAANLSHGTYGNIQCHTDTKRTFDEDKDYLYPIPTDDIVLTGGIIKQNPGWNDGLDF